MIKLIQSITLTQIAWSIAVLIPVFLLFRYWIRKKIKGMKKLEKKKEVDRLLEMDETDRIYENDDREVEYYKPLK